MREESKEERETAEQRDTLNGTERACREKQEMRTKVRP